MKADNSSKLKRFIYSDAFKLFLLYTGAFAIIITAMLILWIFKYDKSFIMSSDGLYQHMVSLTYFREALIDFFKTGNFSTFTWQIGMGMDMFGNLAYYILGDFFSYFSVFCPEKYLDTFYCAMIVVRMYFIGLCFICYCRYKKMKVFPSFIGALMYAFCGYVLYASMRHPYFSNAIMLLPLVMIGVEKIILEDKSLYYTLIIALLFVSNFYFAYMIAFIIAIYGLILAIYTYKKDGILKIIKVLGKVALFSLIGIAISCVVFLPAAVAFFTSERSGASSILPYSINHYRTVLDLLGQNYNYWVIIGVSTLILITLPAFIRRRRENYPLFLTALVLLIPLLFSKAGSMMAGFSYPNNRWSFAFAFIFSVITAWFFYRDIKLDKKDYIGIGLLVIIQLVLYNAFDYKLDLYAQSQLMISVALLIVISLKKDLIKINKYGYKVSFSLVFILGILLAVYYSYDVSDSSFLNSYLDVGEYDSVNDTSNYSNSTFGDQIEYITQNDRSFYRISKYSTSLPNVALLKDFNSIGVYYSMLSNDYTMLSKDLLNAQYEISHGLKEFDWRSKISTLLGTKYFVINADRKGKIPYGYTEIENSKGTYINEFYLPFGVLYKNSISLADFEKMSPLEKESSLLKSVALDDIKSDNNSEKEKWIKEIPYEISDDYEILNNKTIKINNTSKNMLKLSIDEIENSEVYVYFENIDFTPLNKSEKIKSTLNKDSSVLDRRKAQFTYRWYQPNYSYKITAKLDSISTTLSRRDINTPYYVAHNNILFNMGYYDKVSGDITVSLSTIGTYTFDNIKVFAVPFDDYEKDIESLRESNFEVTQYGNGYMSATAKPEHDGILQFATIYNDGWKVLVDGSEAETFKANKYFLGINITAGDHKIELVYKNKFVTYGLYTSLFGTILLLILTLLKKYRRG